MLKLIKVVFIAFVCFSPDVYGFSLSPMVLDMSPYGTSSRSTVTIHNSSPRAMPVRASISELTINQKGNVTSAPNEGSFIIFPTQAIVKPHSKQTFRVQWRGQPNLKLGKTYELTVAQVLAKDNRPKGENNSAALELQFAMAFGAIINMKAAKGNPKPVVRSTKLVKNKSGKYNIEVLISNQSNQNFTLYKAESTISIIGEGNRLLWSYIYTPDNLMREFGIGMVQPNRSRLMKIPVPNLPAHIARQAKSVKLEIRPSAK